METRFCLRCGEEKHPSYACDLYCEDCLASQWVSIGSPRREQPRSRQRELAAEKRAKSQY